MLDAGVELVYRETLDTALEAGTEVLRQMGHRAFLAHRAARTFRRHDEAAMAELARVRHDRKAYVSRARARIRDLEETLLSELEAPDHSLDEAWDTFGWKNGDPHLLRFLELGEFRRAAEAGRPAPDQRDALAGFLGGRLQQAKSMVVGMIGREPLEATDLNRLPVAVGQHARGADDVFGVVAVIV